MNNDREDSPMLDLDFSALEDRIMAMEGARQAYQDAARYGMGIMVVDHNEITPTITHVPYTEFMELPQDLSNEMRGMKTVIVVGDTNRLQPTRLIDHEQGIIDHIRVLTHTARHHSKTRMVDEFVRVLVSYTSKTECIRPLNKVWHEPPPKKISFKQAPRQSFRQSMRSVNRNR